MGMPLTPNPPLNPGSSETVVRPQPTDPDGSDAAGWVKLNPGSGNGWSDIDEAGTDGAPIWEQC